MKCLPQIKSAFHLSLQNTAHEHQSKQMALPNMASPLLPYVLVKQNPPVFQREPNVFEIACKEQHQLAGGKRQMKPHREIIPLQ